MENVQQLLAGGGLVDLLAQLGSPPHTFQVPGEVLAHFPDGHILSFVLTGQIQVASGQGQPHAGQGIASEGQGHP